MATLLHLQAPVGDRAPVTPLAEREESSADLEFVDYLEARLRVMRRERPSSRSARKSLRDAMRELTAAIAAVRHV
jgi:hypothetical protein